MKTFNVNQCGDIRHGVTLDWLAGVVTGKEYSQITALDVGKRIDLKRNWYGFEQRTQEQLFSITRVS